MAIADVGDAWGCSGEFGQDLAVEVGDGELVAVGDDQDVLEGVVDADRDLKALITATAPNLVDPVGVGTEVAGQLLITARDNPERLRSEAAYAV